MRVEIRAAALGLLASAALAAPAAGELAPRIGSPPYGSLAGPVFAGDAVVWGRPLRAGYELVTARPGERIHTRAALPELKTFDRKDVSGQLEASDRRVVLSLYASGCAGCERPYPVVYRAILTGSVGGRLSVVAGCTSASDCAADPCPVGGGFDVSDDAIAYTDCHGIHVRDLASGASPAGRDYPERIEPRIAGSYLASLDRANPDSGAVTVSNWRTGDTVFSIAARAYGGNGYDVQSDGKLAFSDPDGEWTSWASPAEPFAHKVARWNAPYEVRIAGDLIGMELDDPPEDPYDYGPRGWSYDVVGLHPDPEVAENFTPRVFDHEALAGVDFNGERLAWAAHRCRHAWLRIWDPQTDTHSGDLPGVCPLPRIVPGSARVDRERHLSLTLECDVPPGPACVGEARRLGRRGRPLTIVDYRIAERSRKHVSFARNGSLCRAAPHRARAKLLLNPYPTGAPKAEHPVTVTARGPTGGLPGC